MKMNTALVKTGVALIVVASAFMLGGYSVEFSGRAAAWVAVVCALVALCLGLGVQMYDAWGSGTRW